MLREFLDWWLRQIASLLPARLRQGEGRQADALVISADADGAAAELSTRRNGRLASLGRFALDEPGLARAEAALARRGVRQPGRAQATVLLLPAALLLERDVSLPLAAERDPEQVLQFEMDRLTPFDATEVFWTWTLRARDRVRARLHLRVSLVPQAAIRPLLATLSRIGIAPTTLEFATGSGLRRIGMAHTHAGRGRRTRLALAAALCASLALAAIVTPFVRQSLAARALDRRIAALAPGVAAAEALRARITREAAGKDVLVAERGRVGDALAAIAAVTDILPDDTYLTDFTLRSRKLVMNGRSAAAARLIGLLSAAPQLREPAFLAPVTRSETGRADLFSIRAELAP